jgi:hypothetical protein
VLSYEWMLPVWNNPQNWYQHILANWQVNGITTFMSGTPFTVYDSAGVSGQGGAPEISGFPSDRPNLIGNPNAQPHTPDQWLYPSSSANSPFQRLNPVTQAGQFGNAGRNIVQGPGLQQWDFSAFKNFKLAEGKSLQFRSEFFNIFNHANFGLPVNDLNSPNFGKIQTSQPGRLVQLALKFLF